MYACHISRDIELYLIYSVTKKIVNLSSSIETITDGFSLEPGRYRINIFGGVFVFSLSILWTYLGKEKSIGAQI